MAVWYCRDNRPTATVGWNQVTQWPISTAVAAGVLRRQRATPTQLNERVWICIVAGTTLGSEPSWTLTNGSKTTDNTVTWMECTGKPAVNGDLTDTGNWTSVKNTAVALGKIITDNAGTHIFIVTTAGTAGNGAEPSWSTGAVGNTTSDNTATWTYIGTSFSAWAAPFAFLGSACSFAAAGDTIYLGDDHAENYTAGAYTITAPGTASSPNFLYSVDHAASLPPGSGNLLAGAAVTATIAGNVQILLAGNFYCYGVAFTGAGSATFQAICIGFSAGNANVWQRYDTCALKKTGAGADAFSAIHSGITSGEGINSNGCRIDLVNTTMQFGNVADCIGVLGRLTWRNTASAITGSTFPTSLFNPLGTAGVAGSEVVVEGVDLSALGSNTLVANGSNHGSVHYHFIDCKLGSGAVIASTPSAPNADAIDLTRCSSSSSTYIQRRHRYEGSLQEETTIVRTGGASDGTTSISWKIVTTANSRWVLPFEAFPMSIWNSVTGSNVTLTVYGIWNAAALPNNDDIWFDVEYLGSASAPLASLGSGTKSNNLAAGAALTADTSAWDSLVTARANNHAYSLLDAITLGASNPGRVFFCTTAGTSSGSEPGGYASAVDGGSVTDGGAVFRAGVRFSMAVTMSSPQPQLVGYLRAYVKAAKASTTFYIDPSPLLS